MKTNQRQKKHELNTARLADITDIIGIIILAPGPDNDDILRSVLTKLNPIDSDAGLSFLTFGGVTTIRRHLAKSQCLIRCGVDRLRIALGERVRLLQLAARETDNTSVVKYAISSTICCVVTMKSNSGRTDHKLRCRELMANTSRAKFPTMQKQSDVRGGGSLIHKLLVSQHDFPSQLVPSRQ